MLIGERSDYKTVIEQVKKMELAELDDGDFKQFKSF
jgi:FKBP-type peptidyl-prolyl cis-trans isomerase (trigger factor)